MAQDKNSIRVLETVEVDENGDPIHGDEFSGGKTSHDRAVDDLIDGFRTHGADVTVTVHRVGSGGANDLSFIESFPVDKYSETELYTHLARDYGGGEFRLHVRKPGRRGLIENKLVKIERPIAPVVPHGGENSAGLDRLAAMLAEQNRQMMALIQNRPDPRAEMMQNLALMKEMREAFGLGVSTPGAANANGNAAPKSALDSIKEMVATLTAMKALQGTLGGVFGGAEAAETHWLERLMMEHGDKVMTLGAGLMQSLTETSTAKSAAHVAEAVTRQPNPAPRRPPVSRPQVPAPVMNLLKSLHQMAEADSDTDETADNLLADPMTKAFLSGFVKEEKPFKKLCQIFPPVIDNADWWLDLIDALTARLTTPPESGDIPADHGGGDNAAGSNTQ